MSTIADTIRTRFAEIKEHTQQHTALRRVFEHTDNIAFLIAAPFIGLLYVLTFAVVGIVAVFCYGLKAFRVRCRIFHK